MSSSSPDSTPDAAQSFRSKLLGWMVLAIILSYAGLVLPLPWRVITLLACMAGFGCAVALFVSALRNNGSGSGKKPVVALISTVLGVICFGLFALSASVELIFWDSSVAYEECMSSALTNRAQDQCISERENGILDTLPGT